MRVVIIGATEKPDRFAFKAQQMLIEHGHETFPVSLAGKDILGRKGYQSIADIGSTELIDSVTVYLNPSRLADIIEDIIELNPARVIFNPGTESDELSAKLSAAGINAIEDCTLIMLEAGRF